jgi:hypothetical protein
MEWKEYPIKNKKEKGQLDWPHLAYEMPSKTQVTEGKTEKRTQVTGG